MPGQMPDELRGTVQRMIDAGESEDNIAAVIQHYNTTVAPATAKSAGRTAPAPKPRPNVHRDAQGNPYITDDPNDVQGALAGSIQDLAESGAGLDPTVGLLGDLKIPGAVMKAVSGIRLPFRLPSMPSMAGVKMAAGDALKVSGDLLDNDLAGVLNPRVKHAGGMIRRAGEYLSPEVKANPNAGGTLVKGSRAMSTEDALASVVDKARSLPAEPAGSVELPPNRTLTAEGRPSITPDEARPTNPHMRQTGKSSGKPESDYAPKPKMPVPVKPNPNAGGTLVSSPTKVSAEDALAEAVRAANTPAREVVDITPSTPNPLERAGRFIGKDLDFYQTRPRAASPGTTPTPASTPATPAADALDPALVKSEIQKQLEASLEQAGLKKSEGVAKSRSRGAQGNGSQPSATPGLTRNDVEALGLNPDEPITHLTQAMMDKLLEARAARANRYYSESVSEAAAKRSVARGKP